MMTKSARIRMVQARTGPAIALWVPVGSRGTVRALIDQTFPRSAYGHADWRRSVFIVDAKQVDAINRFLRALSEEFSVMWDQRILSSRPAAPTPRGIVSLPRWTGPPAPADRGSAAIRYVNDLELGPALGIILGRYDVDFVVELHEGVPDAGRRFDNENSAWIIADAYMANALSALERFYLPEWDDMILRDMEGLPVPADTRFGRRAASANDYMLLGLKPGATFEELREAYQGRKKLHYAGRLSAEDLAKATDAFERLTRHV